MLCHVHVYTSEVGDAQEERTRGVEVNQHTNSPSPQVCDRMAYLGMLSSWKYSTWKQPGEDSVVRRRRMVRTECWRSF